MFFSSVVVSGVVLAMSTQVYGHAAVANPIGVTGTLVRADALRPNAQEPCGAVTGTIASLLDKSVPVVANGNTFSTTITDFNAGQDGSRQVTAAVDATGVGKTFTAATVTKNGDLAPTAAGSQQLTVELPAGTTCTGGTDKNLCLVQFITAGGFGNCIAVQQGGAAAASGASAAPAASSAATVASSAAPKASAAAASSASSTKASGSAACNAGAEAVKAKGHAHHEKAKTGATKTQASAAKAKATDAKRTPYGARAPRYVRALEDEEDEDEN